MEAADPQIGISFGRQGNCNRFKLEGISTAPDEQMSWTVAPFAAITLNIVHLRPIGSVRISAMPYLANGLIRAQQFWFHVNGIFVGYGVYDAEGEKEFATWEVFRAGVNTLSFVLPDAVSPAQLGVSDDVRPLGLGLKQIMFTAPPPQGRQGARP